MHRQSKCVCTKGLLIVSAAWWHAEMALLNRQLYATMYLHLHCHLHSHLYVHVVLCLHHCKIIKRGDESLPAQSYLDGAREDERKPRALILTTYPHRTK